MTKWTKQYNNDTGPDDDYFEEWFEITDGKRIFRCEEREDADFLLSILSQQAEPVAFASHGVVNWIADKQFQYEADLYTSPQRQWVGLTDEEVEKIIKANMSLQMNLAGIRADFEAAYGIKEKNNV